jgi:hypothetical protein
MSLDARYILKYDTQNYKEPTPMSKDIKYLTEKYGGELQEINWKYDLFYEKPKYTLLEEDIEELKADQVLESLGGDNWQDISYKLKK